MPDQNFMTQCNLILRNNFKKDIGGQERYIHMTHVFYKEADFCLIVFDITSRDSFEACARWKKDLDDKYVMDNGLTCPCLLIGNKVFSQ